MAWPSPLPSCFPCRRRSGGGQFSILSLVLVIVANMAQPSRSAELVHDIGSDKVLLFDNAFLAESAGVRFKLHPARKTGERILVPEHPWESASLNWFSVLEQGGKFRMWYECYDVAGWDSSDDTSFCYAESTDGIHWIKPRLGLFEYCGSKENNILFRQIGTAVLAHASTAPVFSSIPPDRQKPGSRPSPRDCSATWVRSRTGSQG